MADQMRQPNQHFSSLRLFWALRSYFPRLKRICTCSGYKRPLEFIFYLLDLLLVLDLYEIFTHSCKRSTRPLYDSEKFLARLVFGNAIPLELVRIDESAHIGTKTTGIVYVSGFTINSWGPISEAILVHELVHVWQYCQLGAVYIPRALRAQHSEMGYNYGGLAALRKATHYSDFNLEQQGDMVMDYFLLLQDRKASWAVDADADNLALYETFIAQIRNET